MLVVVANLDHRLEVGRSSCRMSLLDDTSNSKALAPVHGRLDRGLRVETERGATVQKGVVSPDVLVEVNRPNDDLLGGMLEVGGLCEAGVGHASTL